MTTRRDTPHSFCSFRAEISSAGGISRKNLCDADSTTGRKRVTINEGKRRRERKDGSNREEEWNIFINVRTLIRRGACNERGIERKRIELL